MGIFSRIGGAVKGFAKNVGARVKKILTPGPLGAGSIVPSLISGAASIGGAVISGKGQEKANETNLKIARENTAFQERMSNTAVSRRMEDMHNAGINPLLAGRYDASTPPGNVATMGNTGAAFVEGGTRAASVALTAMQARVMRAQAGNIDADTALKRSQTGLTDQKLINEGLQAVGLNTGNDRQKVELALAKLRIPRARTLNELFQLINENTKEGLATLKKIAHEAGGAAGWASMKLEEWLEWMEARMRNDFIGRHLIPERD